MDGIRRQKYESRLTQISKNFHCEKYLDTRNALKGCNQQILNTAESHLKPKVDIKTCGVFCFCCSENC